MSTATTTDSETGRDIGAAVQDTTENVTRSIGEAADTVREFASAAADRVPDAAASAQGLLIEVDRQMRGGSDEALTAGAMLATGMAAGLFVAGANRAIVTLAIVPAVAMALTVLGRSSGTAKGRRTRD